MYRIALAFFIGCVFVCPPSFSAEDALPLSLKQCVDLALKNNVQVLVARAQAQAAQGQETLAYAALLPQVDAVASQQRTWWENISALGFPGFSGVIGPFNSFNAGFMVSQRILDFSAMAHAQAERFNANSFAFAVQLASQQMILATGLAYIEVLGLEDQLAASDEDVRLSQQFLSLSLHQQDAGLASSLDVARDRTQLAQQQAHRQELRLGLIRAQLALKRLIKIPLSENIDLTDTLVKQDHDYLDAVDALIQANMNRMELQVAGAETQYREAELKSSREAVLPTVNLTGEWGGAGLTPDHEVTHAANAMLSFSLPIWESGRISGDIKEKKGLSEQQQAQEDDLHWKIEEDVRLSLATLSSTRTQLDAQKKVEDFALQELNLAQDRFKAGLGDNIQLIDAQTVLADAKDKYVQALSVYNQAQLNYFAALGKPNQFDLAIHQQEGED